MPPKEGDSFDEDQEQVAGEALNNLCRCNRVGSVASCWVQKSNWAKFLTKRKSSCVHRCWLVSHRAFGGRSMGQERIKQGSAAPWPGEDGAKA